MPLSIDIEQDREPRQPLVVVALCFVVGVVLGFHLLLNLWWWVVGVLLCCAVNLLFGWRWVALLAVLLSGGVAAGLSHRGVESVEGRGIYALRITSPNRAEMVAVQGGDGVWRVTEQPMVYGCDSTLNFRAGDRVVVSGRVKRFATRGYIYISHSGLVEHSEQARLGERVNDVLSGRLSRLSLNEESNALVRAMLLGKRGDVDSRVMEDYRHSGAAHLLAVSGLHVGIVALILSMLLMPLSMFWRGHILRSFIVLALVWGYAYVVGMSASVVRATIMYSFLMLSPIMMRRYNSLNILAFALLVMTLLNPLSIYDVGFQLSFLSVAAILLWALPLWSLRGAALRRWWCDWLLLPMLIGAICTVVTLPLVSYTFGYISLFGVLLNPLLLVTTYLLLALSLLWVVVGWALWFAAPLFRWAIEICVALQNGVVAWAASGWRDAIDLRLEGISVVLIYTLYLVATIIFTRYINRRREIKVIKSL